MLIRPYSASSPDPPRRGSSAHRRPICGIWVSVSLSSLSCTPIALCTHYRSIDPPSRRVVPPPAARPSSPDVVTAVAAAAAAAATPMPASPFRAGSLITGRAALDGSSWRDYIEGVYPRNSFFCSLICRSRKSAKIVRFSQRRASERSRSIGRTTSLFLSIRLAPARSSRRMLGTDVRFPEDFGDRVSHQPSLAS